MKQETLKLLQGLHTIETIADKLKIQRTSALNLVSRMKKQGYLTTSGGGKRKRLYTISTKKQVQGKGMFDLINKYAKTGVYPSFKHIAYGKYAVENALIDAIKTKDFRVIKASLYLFNQIKNWKKLHRLAKTKDIEQEVGALYDSARLFIKTRKMPENIRKSLHGARQKTIIPHLKTTDPQLKAISQEWKVIIPFNKRDLEELR